MKVVPLLLFLIVAFCASLFLIEFWHEKQKERDRILHEMEMERGREWIRTAGTVIMTAVVIYSGFSFAAANGFLHVAKNVHDVVSRANNLTKFYDKLGIF